jgi:tetratricopeptide (TPR) repeat protein
MRRPFLAALVACVTWVSAAVPCGAEWRRIDTPNFTVIGDVSARTLRDVAVKFEGFRETLTRVLRARATSTAVPTVVIVFPSDRAFTPFKPLYQEKPVDIAGLFVAREDENYIAVVADGRPGAMRVVFHEYAHLMVSNLWRNAPAWVNEGFAEFYSTYEVSNDGGEALIGRTAVEHLRELNDSPPLKLADLLSVDRDSPLYNERDRQSVFYAQSWALTHLIVLGKQPRLKELGTYLEFLAQGMAATLAWNKAFDPADMEAELKAYVRGGTFKNVRVKFSEKLAKFEAEAAPLGSADAEAFLADFLMQQGRTGEAVARLDAAEKLNPQNLRVRVTRATLEIGNGNGEAAEKQLMAIGHADDWLLAYNAGVSLVELVERRRDTPTAEQLQAVRALFESVRKQHADVPNLNARLASMELRSAAGPSKDTRLAIERARLMAPSREDYAFLHAQILAHQQEYGLARNIIGPLMSQAYPADVREAARDLMRYVVELEARRQPGAQPALSSSTLATNLDTDSTDSSRPGEKMANAVSLILRELKDGEQRTEGVLERIECSARGGAVFHIRGQPGIQTLTAPRMRDVEFISYRDDLSGSVTCGPVKPPLPVMVTWRDDATSKAAKRVIAIEFLPK